MKLFSILVVLTAVATPSKAFDFFELPEPTPINPTIYWYTSWNLTNRISERPTHFGLRFYRPEDLLPLNFVQPFNVQSIARLRAKHRVIHVPYGREYRTIEIFPFSYVHVGKHPLPLQSPEESFDVFPDDLVTLTVVNTFMLESPQSTAVSLSPVTQPRTPQPITITFWATIERSQDLKNWSEYEQVPIEITVTPEEYSKISKQFYRLKLP